MIDSPPAIRDNIDAWIENLGPTFSSGRGRWQPASSFRVGVDLVSVNDVAGSVRIFGDRYVRRIFTPHEVASCRGGEVSGDRSTQYCFESLAARFAAKEAVVKVLRPVGARPDWRQIEVHRSNGGWCEIRLSGRAAAMAEQDGIDELAVSLTHEASTAAAVVVGMCSGSTASGLVGTGDGGEA